VPQVQVMVPAGLNVYDILKHTHLVLFSPALSAIEARLAK
jgi:ribosomal protein L4